MPQQNGVTVDALRSMPIFESLSVERLVPIARVAVFRKVPRGTTILRAGDRTDFVYFILSGVLKVLVSDEEGREVILSNLGAGRILRRDGRARRQPALGHGGGDPRPASWW
jgi:CRP/FNR family cyclic AMP-dependent transcriptional regulator